MPVVSSGRLGDLPRLIQRLHNLLRQRALLNILQIALQLRLTTDTDNDTIITSILDIQLRVVNHPSERRLQQSEVVLLHNGLNDSQSFEGGVFEVALAVHASTCAFGVAETAGLRNVSGFVFAAEKAAGDGVVDYDVEAVAAAGGDQLGFYGAGDCVVLYEVSVRMFAWNLQEVWRGY